MEYFSSNPLGVDLHLLASSFVNAVNITSVDSTASASTASTSLVARRAHHSHDPSRPQSSLCYNREGWGPYSTVRDTDLTPCFESGVIVIPALLLVLVGSLVSVMLARKTKRPRDKMSERLLAWKMVSPIPVLVYVCQLGREGWRRMPARGGGGRERLRELTLDPSPRPRLLPAQILLALLTTLAAANFTLTILSVHSHHVPLLSIDPLSSLVLLLGSVVTLPLTFYTHTRTRRASDLLLAFWTVTLVLAIPSLRTRYLVGVLSQPRQKLDVGSWATFLAWVVVGAAAFALECLGPEWAGFGRDEGKIRLDEEGEAADADPKKEKAVQPKENPALTANLFSIITFAWLTPLMKLGASRFIDENDIFDRQSHRGPAFSVAPPTDLSFLHPSRPFSRADRPVGRPRRATRA